MLLEDARIGDIVFDRQDRSLWGVRHSNGLATLVHIPYPYDDWKQVHTFPYGVEAVRPRHLARRQAPVGVDERGERRPVPARLRDRQAAGGRREAAQRIQVRRLGARGLRLLARRQVPLRQRATTRVCRTSSATRSRRARSRRCRTPSPGYFRPVQLADGTLMVFHYTGQGFVPVVIEPKVVKDVSAITFLGTALVDKYPVLKTWQVPPPSTVDDEKLVIAKGPYVPLHTLGLESAYPVLQGYKDYVGVGYHVNFDRSAAPREDRPHGRLHAQPTACRGPRSAATSRRSTTTSTGPARCPTTARTSTTSSVPPS